MKPRCPGSDIVCRLENIWPDLHYSHNQVYWGQFLYSNHCCIVSAKQLIELIWFILGHLLWQVAYSLIVFNARFAWIKPVQSKPTMAAMANTSLREGEHLFPGTCQGRLLYVGLCLRVWTVLSDQSCLINCPLSCWFLAETEEMCRWVVDPADVHSVSGHSSPQSRSINEHQIFAHNGFLGRVRGPLNPQLDRMTLKHSTWNQ